MIVTLLLSHAMTQSGLVIYSISGRFHQRNGYTSPTSSWPTERLRLVFISGFSSIATSGGGDHICGWGAVSHGGYGGSPPENVEFGRCDLLYSGAFWGWPLPNNSFRFIDYTS